MRPLPFPADIYAPQVGDLSVDLATFSARFGSAPFVETDEFRTHGGPESSWAFQFDDGQKVLIELSHLAKRAFITAEPPDAARAFRNLGFDPTDPRIRIYDPPLQPPPRRNA